MTKTMKASECKAKFLGVLDEVAANHEPVIVTKNGRPVAADRAVRGEAQDDFSAR